VYILGNKSSQDQKFQGAERTFAPWNFCSGSKISRERKGQVPNTAVQQNVASIVKSWYLAPWTGENKVCIDILLTKLFSYIDTNGAITVVDVPLHSITQDTIGVIYFLKL